MRLIAGLIVHNEADRYLKTCVDSLLEFCDEVRILDDGSDDVLNDMSSWWMKRVYVKIQERGFYQHEARAREALNEWVMRGDPTHILAIDADEFVTDGAELRKVLREHRDLPVFTLCMEEVWKAGETLSIRMDGGWAPHEISGVWNPQMILGHQFRDAALACGRVPASVDAIVSSRQSATSGVGYLHFGWANEKDRAARHARYVEHDGGAFHNSRHLDSIMWPDKQVRLCTEPWPEGMVNQMERVRERANR
jgi:hypothetical protein